jgi:hypothetical protein
MEFTPAPEAIRKAKKEDREAYENATRGQRGLVEVENTTPGGCCRFNAPDSANGWPSLVDVTKTYCGRGMFKRNLMAADMVEGAKKEEPEKE